MRHRVRFTLSLLALFSGATAAPSEELCEATARAPGSSKSAALLQKAASSSIQLEVKHPDLTDGPVPWKPDTRKPLPASSSPPPSTMATTTTTSTQLASTTTFTTTTTITTTVTTTSTAVNVSNATDAMTTPAPIVVNSSNISGVGNVSGGGCCFSYGFGAMMEPCCLKSSMVADRSHCSEENVIGSRTSFTPGTCPSSPREAADLAEATADALNAACTPGNSCGEKVLPKDRGICIKPAEGSPMCWDICDTSHMPEDYTLGDGDEDFHERLAQAVRDVREGRYPELSCPGVAINESLSGDSYEEQLAAAATNASQADSMADEATAMAEQLLAEARNNFAKAMNDGATPDTLAAAAKTWEDAANAHAKAHDAAAIAAERIKALSQLLAKGSRQAATELARKKEDARKKEAEARKKKEIAAKKRQEAEQAKELAIKALEEAKRARAEAKAAVAGSINITYGEPPTDATLTWNASRNASWNASAKVVVPE